MGAARCVDRVVYLSRRRLNDIVGLVGVFDLTLTAL